MMGVSLLGLFCALALFPGGQALVVQRVSAQGGGLDQVVTILLDMMSDFRAQVTADEAAWNGYQKWAQETEVERTEYVRNMEGLALQNTALVNAKRLDVARLAGEIVALATSISDTQRSLNELIAMRGREHEQHTVQLTDLIKTIDAVNRAIQILEGHYAASATALTEIRERVQFALTLTNMQAKTNPLSSLMQRTPDWLNADGGKYNTYEKQGGAHGVIGTLNDLRSQLDANKQSSIETESESRRSFEDQKGMQEATLARLQAERNQKTAEKNEASSAITMAEATVAEANQNKVDAQNTITQLTADLATFTSEYQTRQQTRSGEASATQAALDALQSVKSGLAASFLQFGLQNLVRCQRCASEETKLRQLAKSMHSDSLLQIANELSQRSHGKGFFDANAMDPVKDLLSKLIERLENEATAEGSHHDWCETEKSSSVTAKVHREETIKTLQADVDRFTVAVAQLAGEIKFLEEEIVRVNTENQEATTNRNDAHGVYVKAVADHTEVISAIGQALRALNGQYSMVQTVHKQSPFANYASGAGAAGSAATMLEDLLQRYSAAKADLITDEQNAVTAYDDLMALNRQFLTDSETTKNAKLVERRGKLQQLSNDKTELQVNFLELKELAQYLQDLRPSCDDIRSTFEERKRRREAEITALRECLDILSDPSAIGR